MVIDVLMHSFGIGILLGQYLSHDLLRGVDRFGLTTGIQDITGSSYCGFSGFWIASVFSRTWVQVLNCLWMWTLAARDEPVSLVEDEVAGQS